MLSPDKREKEANSARRERLPGVKVPPIDIDSPDLSGRITLDVPF